MGSEASPPSPSPKRSKSATRQSPTAFASRRARNSGDVTDSEGNVFKTVPKEVAESDWYFLTGKLRTFDDVVRDDDPRRKSIRMRSNMECNGWWIVLENNNSWRHTSRFGEKDVVVDLTGAIVDRGDDPKWVAYRKAKDAVKR